MGFFSILSFFHAGELEINEKPLLFLEKGGGVYSWKLFFHHYTRPFILMPLSADDRFLRTAWITLHY